MARSAVAADLQPIDRLEEKILQLVGMIVARRLPFLQRHERRNRLPLDLVSPSDDGR